MNLNDWENLFEPSSIKSNIWMIMVREFHEECCWQWSTVVTVSKRSEMAHCGEFLEKCAALQTLYSLTHSLTYLLTYPLRILQEKFEFCTFWRD